MNFTPTPIHGLVIIDPDVFRDDRGWFMESFNEAKFHAGLRGLGLTPPRAMVQDNHSVSSKGVLRGLHYQAAPQPQGKLVRVVRGRAWDVAVDLRQNSPTLGQWFGVELSSDNALQFWIPEGFAHGFLALEDDTHFLYKTTDVYAKDCERSLRWDDPTVAIDWPLKEIAATKPNLAAKDAIAPDWANAARF